MSPEKIIHGYQRTLKLPTAPRRLATVGILIDTREVIPVEHIPNPQLVLGYKGIGRYERMPHTRGMEYWIKAYETEIASRKLDPQAEWKEHSETYFGMLKGIKSDLKRIKEGDVREEEEQLYNDPEFFKEILFSKNIRPDKVHRYGLIALSIETTDPLKAKLFENYGFALLEKAEEMEPRNLRFKLALWKKHDRKALERPKLKRKAKKEAEKQEKKYRLTPTLINRLNNPELGREFTTIYYIEKADHWTNVLERVSKGRQIDYQEFGRKHAIYVNAAKKEMDDRRGPDKRRKRYTSQFFEDWLNYEDLDAFNAYYWGLVALYIPTKIEKEKRKCQLLGFLLLEAAPDLSAIERKIDGKNPTAFYPWAINEECLVKMARPGIQSKRQVRSRDVSNMITRAGGGEPEEVRDRKRPGNISQEALPF